MIISINGDAGSGKSTIVNMLKKKLGWPKYDIGGIRRIKARERGMTLPEYNKLGETDPSTDREVDEYQAELGKTKDNFLISGRTSWFFIPASVKVFLKVGERTAAERIFNDLQKDNHRNEGSGLNTAEDVLQSIRQRKQSDIIRYQKHYGIDIFNMDNYDLIIDASRLKPEEVMQKILDFIQKKP